MFEKKNLRNAVLNCGAVLADAIKSLNESMAQIVVVVDKQNKLVGTLTDGDIRRALLNSCNLSTKVDDIVNREPISASVNVDTGRLQDLMISSSIRAIPIVDENMGLVDLKFLNSLHHVNAKNLMVIMAGGKGERLRPRTNYLPKPMIEISGKPMLEHILCRARSYEVKNFLISINYLGDQIENYFEDGSRWGVCIEYLREPKPLGTAGSLSLAQYSFDSPFLVTNGDVLTGLDYTKVINFHKSCDAAATMVVRQYGLKNPFGVVEMDGIDITSCSEKPIIMNFINAGIYVLSPEALNFLKKDSRCDMPELFSALREAGLRTVAYPIFEPWLDVGKKEDLKLAEDNVAMDVHDRDKFTS